MAYVYDAAGMRTRLTLADGAVVTWVQDATNQLTSEKRSGANAFHITHVYDPVGSRLLEIDSGARTTFTFDAANQLKTAAAAAGVTTYAFDAAGNQRLVIEPGNLRTTTTWDDENRSTLVRESNGSRTTMTYNAINRRVRKEPQ